MSALVQEKLTFDDYVARNFDGRFELVDGRLEPLVAPRPRHGWTYAELSAALSPYLHEHHPGGYWGGEVDIPTVAFHGRRPDFIFYTREAAAVGIDLDADRVLAVPTLVVEIVSEDDEPRDLVTKRREYAEAGIPHYWILDPRRRTALFLHLRDGAYEVEARFARGQELASQLFPGLTIPLKRLFR
jgi:Uma2 family endonuclease